MSSYRTKRTKLMKQACGITLILALCLAVVGCKPKSEPGRINAPPQNKIVPPRGFEKIEQINPTIMQAFYWEMGTKVGPNDYLKKYPKETNLWRLLAERAPGLKQVGISGLWLPPAAKAMAGGNSVGYDVYDLWDLGEFDQKGTVRTKYGTRAELDNALKALHAQGIAVYFDAVLNHRMGADEQEDVPLHVKSGGGHSWEWTKYTFPGREGKYAEYGAKPEWNWEYFDGIDGEDGGLLFSGKEWDDCVPDYLMGADVDYQYPAVREEIKAWGRWIIDEVGFDGFRLDAVKHVDNGFIHEWIDHVQNSSGKDVFFVGEAWIEDSNQLINYINAVDSPHLKVFDFPLHSYFLALANGGGGLNNMSRLAHVGLVNHPDYRDRAVTFADNHDTNRDGEAAGVHRYKYQAYAYLLTREYGIPCVWWKDYYIYGMKTGIDKLLLARKYYAYGPGYEVDNNDLDVYSYVRAGIPGTGTGLVLMLTDGPTGGKQIVSKRIDARKPNTTFYDLTGHVSGTVTTDGQGYGDFKVRMSEGEGWSVWVECPNQN